VCPFKADHDFILCTLGNKGELSQNLPRNATEPKMMTPYEKLKSLDQSEGYLKDALSFELLDKEAYKVSNNQAADQMNLAKKRLFKQINEQKKA
jgi:hypothetical protein